MASGIKEVPHEKRRKRRNPKYDPGGGGRLVCINWATYTSDGRNPGRDICPRYGPHHDHPVRRRRADHAGHPADLEELSGRGGADTGGGVHHAQWPVLPAGTVRSRNSPGAPAA